MNDKNCQTDYTKEKTDIHPDSILGIMENIQRSAEEMSGRVWQVWLEVKSHKGGPQHTIMETVVEDGLVEAVDLAKKKFLFGRPGGEIIKFKGARRRSW